MSHLNFQDLIQQKKDQLVEINENALFYFLKSISELAHLTQCGLAIYEASYNNASTSMYKIGLVNCSEEYFSDQLNKPSKKQFDENNFITLNLDSLQSVMKIVNKKSLHSNLDSIVPLLAFVNDFNLLTKPDDTNFYLEFRNFLLVKTEKKLRAITQGARLILMSEENFDYDFKGLFASADQFSRYEKFLLKNALPLSAAPGRSLKV